MKTFTLFILLSFTTCITNAQKNKLSFGLQVGLNRSSFIKNNIFKNHPKSLTGPAISGIIKYKISQKMSVVAYPGYEENRFDLGYGEAKDNSGNVYFKAYFKSFYKYLTLPVVLQFTTGNKLKFEIATGIYTDYFLDFNLKTTAIYPSYQQMNDHSGAYSYRKINLGLTGETGIAYPINKKIQLHLTIRDNLGLTYITKKEYLNNGSNKINSINFLVGATINLK